MIIQVLEQIEDWRARAEAAGYCVQKLAERCCVSVRTIERFFAEKFGLSPWDWLNEERMKRARELLADGSSVKETAICLAYHNPSRFSLDFKRHHGYAPSEHARQMMRKRAIQSANCRDLI